MQLPLIFQDHMILQRGKEIDIWGSAEAGAEVTVSVQKQEKKTTADADGKWKMKIGPLEASFSEEVCIAAGEDVTVLHDVQVGEVWLAGGQSNMEFHMRYDADMKTEKETCTNDAIRFFDYPEVSYVGQIDEADYKTNYGFWRKAEPEQLERFSAVGYYFAKELQQKYGVPVGIIGCNWGGSPACAWMNEEAVKAGGGQIYLDEYEEAVKNLDLNAYEEAFRNNPMAWNTDLLGNPMSDLMMFGASEEEFAALLSKMGIDPSVLAEGEFFPPMGPKYERRPCGLYESMLKPLAPYGIRGVIWYQGETDGDTHPEIYKTLFPELIRTWRNLWNEELPFLFTQIAPLERWMDCIGAAYVEIREAQQITADTVAGTAMASSSDAGMRNDIHPKKKQPIGHRLALLAENRVYGEDILCDAPHLVSGRIVQDGVIELAFANAGTGLYLADHLPDGNKVDAGRIGGLRILQNGEELPEESLRAEVVQIDESGLKGSVRISAPAIRAGIPAEIKLAKTGWYTVNLYNNAGIPAVPGEMTI
ncbi:MAG: sialate O-acetylesterase [Eubacteriales bacterium]|nr:sialate O-acetylesterase [Eubacteriales bacterium]